MSETASFDLTKSLKSSTGGSLFFATLCKKTLQRFGYRLINATRRWGVNHVDDIKRIVGDPRRVKCIFDVGANVGNTAIEYSNEFPAAKVVAFEPVRDTFAVLTVNTHLRISIIPIQKALGNFIGFAKCAIHQDCRNNTLVDGLTDELHSVAHGEQQVEVTTLDAIMTERKIEYIDILKIDAEGFDLAVLQGAKKSLELKKVKFIYFEFHQLLRQSVGVQLGDLMTIANFLDGYGYRFITVYTDSVHGAESLGTYNALFLAKGSGDSWRY